MLDPTGCPSERGLLMNNESSAVLPEPLARLPALRTANDERHASDWPSASDCGSYENCLRRCTACSIGFSNGKTSPTLIHSDPTGNVPAKFDRGTPDARGGNQHPQPKEQGQKVGFRVLLKTPSPGRCSRF